MKKQICSLIALLVTVISIQAPATEIEINGELAQVSFNDGDTFRILTGTLKGKRSRLQGFNTLESYGPVQRWGKFTPVELLKNAKEATLNAKKGGWHCVTDLSTDIYGRILSRCRDLASDQLMKGYAHLMTVNEESADPELIKIQHKAMSQGYGMWAKGVPEYIVSSLHSLDENPNERSTYNRLISTRDGHSRIEVHANTYSDCDEVCAPVAAGSSPEDRVESCMIYVNYKNRFGPRMASCLRQ